MSLTIQRWHARRPEDGPAPGARLHPDDRHRVGPCSRTTAEVLDALALPLDAIVIATTTGEPVAPLDPHGTLRRVIHRGFAPRLGTTVVSAGDRSVVAGLWEVTLRKREATASVGFVAVDWVSAREFAVGFAVGPGSGVSISDPRVSRHNAPSERGPGERSSLAGALRLLEALEAGGSGRDVMLDRAPRDGVAWTVDVGVQQS